MLVKQIPWYDGVRNCCSIKGSPIVTWTLWFRNHAGNHQSSVNGWHAIWVSPHARPPRIDKLQYFAQTLQPLFPRQAQGEAAFLLPKPQAHTQEIHKHWSNVKTAFWGLTGLIFHCSKKKKIVLPLQHFLHPSDFYEESNSGLIKHATTTIKKQKSISYHLS